MSSPRERVGAWLEAFELKPGDAPRPLLSSDVAYLLAHHTSNLEAIATLREARDQMRRSGGQNVLLNGAQLDRILRQLEGPAV